MSIVNTDAGRQAAALKAARARRGWSQSRLAAALEHAASVMGKTSDLPPGGRQTIVQYISYFENGKRLVPDRLKPLFCEVFEATADDLGLKSEGYSGGSVKLPTLPVTHLESSSSAVMSSLYSILQVNVQADAQIGPAYVIPGVEANLSVVNQICRMTRGDCHDLALRLASQYSEFCGWLYQDSGDYKRATYWTNQSLEYAAELDDRRVVSYVLMRKSNIASDAHQPGNSLGLANAALKSYDLLTPRLRAVALRQRATALAMLNETSAFAINSERALVEATAGTTQDEPDLAPYCTPSFVEMEAGASWLALGSADAAVPVFEASLNRGDASGQGRDRALCLARLATAHAAAGEPDRACVVAENLIEVAAGLSSGRVAKQVMDLRRVLGRWRADAAVTHLLRRLESFKVPLN